MSDSTRETQSLANKGRRALTNPWLWLSASVVAHGFIFGTAEVVRPKDGILLTAGGQKLAITPKEAGEIVQNLASRHAEDVRKQIAELKKIADEMKAIEAEKAKQFKDFAKESTSDAPQKIAEATAEAEASQRDAAKAQAAAVKDLADAVAKAPSGNADASTSAATESQTAARRNQVAAQESQDQAINHLKMLGSVADPAVTAQKQASDLQSAAGMQQDYANAARADAHAAVVAKAPDAPQKLAGAADAQRKAAELQAKANEAQAGLHDVLKKVLAQAGAGNALAGVDSTAGQVSTMPADDSAATQPLADGADLKGESLDQLYNQGVAIEGQLAQMYRTLRAQDLAMIRKMSLADAMKLTELTKPDRPKLDASALNQPITSGAEMQRAKDQIGLAEAETSSMLSQGRDMLAQAKGLTGDTEGAAAMNQVLQRAANTEASEQMAADDGSGAARDMTRFAPPDEVHGHKGGLEGGPEGGGDGVNADGGGGAAVAEESGSGRLGHPHHHHGGTGPEGVGDGPEGGVPSGGMAGGLSRGVQWGNGRGKGNGIGMGAGAVGGNAADPSFGYGQAIRVPGLPPMEQLAAESTFGRTVASGLANKDWMYVDTWYLIGPFPNPNRANINRQFPPDQQIDLDAVYIGKDNRKVRWQFYQSPRPNVTPPDDEQYQIYYAYTELYFDSPRDLWVFVGSDDQSRMYVNDVCYWKSSDILKGWKPDEGKRKIHFKKGVNRILFRVENGWNSTAFSMILQIKGDS